MKDIKIYYNCASDIVHKSQGLTEVTAPLSLQSTAVSALP